MDLKLIATVLIASVIGGIVGGMVGGSVAPKSFLGAEGDTNLTNLVLSGSLSVGGNTTTTGTFSAGTSTFGNVAMGNGTLTLSLTTSSPTQTLTAAQMCGNGVVLLNQVGLSSITTGTLTFASATQTAAACLTNTGGRLKFMIRNLGTGTSSVTLAGGTGSSISVSTPSSTAPTVTGSSTATGVGLIELYQESATTSTVLLIKGI